MHYGSLGKYTGGTLITEMNDACCFAPVCVRKRVHLQFCELSCTQRGHLTEKVSR